MQDIYAHNERHLVTPTGLDRNLYNFLMGSLRIIPAYPIDKQAAHNTARRAFNCGKGQQVRDTLYVGVLSLKSQ